MHKKASIVIKMLGLAIAFVCNTASSQDQVFKLVSEGKGLSAQKLLEERIKTSTGQEKIKAINALLDVCMLTTDIKCSTGIFNEYQKILFDDLNSLPTSNDQERLARTLKYDSVISKYDYAASLGINEDYLKQSAEFEKDKFLGKPFYEYASIRATMKARLTLYILFI